MLNTEINLAGWSSHFQMGHLLTIAVIGIIPLIFLATTSYLKITVVFSILRTALGGGQIPSQAICSILSLIISLYIMSPILESLPHRFDDSNNMKMLERIEYISSPLIKFVRDNVKNRERIFFYKLENSKRSELIKLPRCEEVSAQEVTNCLNLNESKASLVLAFISGELRTACVIGVYLFVPFLIIDMVVSTLLTGLGMMMVSPTTITLPIKLLVFMLSDGWRLLIQNLVLSYK